MLASLIEGLSAPTNRARIWRGRTQAGAQERTVREHQAILDALAAGEPDIAHAAMVSHVAGVESVAAHCAMIPASDIRSIESSLLPLWPLTRPERAI